MDNVKVTNQKTTFDADNNDDYDVATDNIGGLHYQYVKLGFGADNEINRVSSTDPLPVDSSGSSVAVTDVTPGTGASNLGKAEDAVHTSGDVGVMVLGVRQDTQTNFGADGDYVPLSINANGEVRVTSAGGGGGGTSETDDTAFTAGTDAGTPIMGFATSDPVDAGDVGVLAMDTARNLKVSLEVDNAGLATAANQLPDGHNVTVDNAAGASAVNIQDGGNSITVDDGGTSLTVDGTVTANLGTIGDVATETTLSAVDTSLNNIEAGYAAEGAALGSGVLLQGDDGTDRKNINVDATTGDVQVDVTNTVSVTGTVTANLGTIADVATETTLSSVDTSLNNIEAGFATEGSALGSGVLLQGDDGTDRKNINVDATTGDVQVDVTNTVAVNGTVTANAGSGTFTVTDNGSFTLAANSGVDIGDVTINNASGASAVNVQDGGNSLTVDDGGASLTVDGSVSATQSGSWSVTTTQLTASNLNAQVVGSVSHDAVDSGRPVKIGAKVTDYEPDTEGEQGQSEVGASDRADIQTNLRGQLIEGVNSQYVLLDDSSSINLTYNNVNTTATSKSVECWNYRFATIGFSLSSSGSPTDITIQVQGSLDGTNFFDMTNGPLGNFLYDDLATASGIDIMYTFPIACQKIRVVVTATGTDASNTFTMSNATIYLRN